MGEEREKKICLTILNKENKKFADLFAISLN